MNDTLEVSKFIRLLNKYTLTKHQRKTLRGQAINGDLEGAKKGLEKLTTVKIYK
jgi:hypothetical protein